MEYNLIATSTFGLEAIVAQELRDLGYDDLDIENGRVSFRGDERDIATCNIWLRTADRILINLAQYKAETFEELFQGTLKIDWGNIIPHDGFMHVTGKSVKSKLFSVPDCQSIVKKAVIESMKRKHGDIPFTEKGDEYKIEVSLLKDIATITLDTTGPGLHKRGYREYAGEAPIKETLAAALVLLSRWKNDKTLADPFCGSGTIPIEAALIGKNIAPGLNRCFISENWSIISKRVWDETREHARHSINNDEFRILASDIDGEVLRTARQNAKKAGVEDFIAFQKLPVEEFSSKKKNGVIICNPPYGERLGESKEIKRLYKAMGEVFLNLEQWSYYIITAHTEFESLFGKKSDKNRKLYNGKLLCYLYSYFKK